MESSLLEHAGYKNVRFRELTLTDWLGLCDKVATNRVVAQSAFSRWARETGQGGKRLTIRYALCSDMQVEVGPARAEKDWKAWMLLDDSAALSFEHELLGLFGRSEMSKTKEPYIQIDGVGAYTAEDLSIDLPGMTRRITPPGYRGNEDSRYCFRLAEGEPTSELTKLCEKLVGMGYKAAVVTPV